MSGKHNSDEAGTYLARFCYRGQRRHDLENDYFNLYHPVDERLPRVRSLPDNQLIHVTRLYINKELRTSPLTTKLWCGAAASTLLMCAWTDWTGRTPRGRLSAPSTGAAGGLSGSG